MAWALFIVAATFLAAIFKIRRDFMKHNELIAAKREQAVCPACSVSVTEMFTLTDEIAMERCLEARRNSQQVRITTCGHPVMIECSGCGEMLSFQKDDDITPEQEYAG